MTESDFLSSRIGVEFTINGMPYATTTQPESIPHTLWLGDKEATYEVCITIDQASNDTLKGVWAVVHPVRLRGSYGEADESIVLKTSKDGGVTITIFN